MVLDNKIVRKGFRGQSAALSLIGFMILFILMVNFQPVAQTTADQAINQAGPLNPISLLYWAFPLSIALIPVANLISSMFPSRSGF